MSPVHAAWAMSGAGAVIFFLMGYLYHRLSRTAAVAAALGQALEELVVAEAKVASLEVALARERQQHAEQRNSEVAVAEARASSLEAALVEEKKLHVEQERKAAADAEARASSLEIALAGAKESRSDVNKELARLRNQEQELLTKQRWLEKELKDAKAKLTEARAKAKDEPAGEQEESVKKLRTRIRTNERELELARTLKAFAERNWPQYKKQRPPRDSEPPADTHRGRVRPSSVPAPDDERSGRSRADSQHPDRDMRRLDQRLRSVGSPTPAPTPAPSDVGVMDAWEELSVESEVRRKVGDLVLEVAGMGGVNVAALADAHGLLLSAEGDPLYHDSMAAFCGLVGQLTTYAHQFLPVSEILECYFHDRHDKVFSVWFFRVGLNEFSLSTVSNDSLASSESVLESIFALAEALDREERE